MNWQRALKQNGVKQTGVKHGLGVLRFNVLTAVNNQDYCLLKVTPASFEQMYRRCHLKTDSTLLSNGGTLAPEFHDVTYQTTGIFKIKKQQNGRPWTAVIC
jgi:hypothetical protein